MIMDNERLIEATKELKELKTRYDRKFNYDEIDFHSIDINPDLRFVCNGDKKEIEVIKEERTDDLLIK